MNTNIVCWFEIYVNDMPRAKTFYETVLNQELTRLDNPDSTKRFSTARDVGISNGRAARC